MLPILKFIPYFKPVIWGGERIARLKGIDSPRHDIGESWEISPLPGHESVVAEGKYKGTTINELCARFPVEMLGKHVSDRWKGTFPLLVKFIDSNDTLSIQVHPDDELALRRHNALGKTELWYALEPLDDAFIYLGLTRRVKPDEFNSLVASGNIISVLRKIPVKSGDVFFIPSGRIHALGKGNLVVEIQEASDITYRIYDYNRRDSQGRTRELHVEQSVDAIDFHDTVEEHHNLLPSPGQTLQLGKCQYFTTDAINVAGETSLDFARRDSFTILVNIGGDLKITSPDGETVSFPQGTSVLIPAEIPSVTITGHGRLLSTHL